MLGPLAGSSVISSSIRATIRGSSANAHELFNGLIGRRSSLPNARERGEPPDREIQVKIIDAHVHVLVDNPGYGRNLSVEELIEKLDENSIDKAIIVQSKRGNGLDSPYPVESAKRFPARLIAISGCDALAPDAADLFRFRVTQWGARGIRLFWAGWRQSETRYDPIWAVASELGVPILMAGENAQYTDLVDVLRRFPKLQIVLDYMVDADISDGVPADLQLLADQPNVVLKFFATFLFDQTEKAKVSAQGFFDALVEAFGADRMMWGSNYPSDAEPRWPYPRSIEAVRSLLVRYGEDQQERMMSGTAIALWPELGR